jgi:hypothetical protein
MHTREDFVENKARDIWPKCFKEHGLAANVNQAVAEHGRQRREQQAVGLGHGQHPRGRRKERHRLKAHLYAWVRQERRHHARQLAAEQRARACSLETIKKTN